MRLTPLIYTTKLNLVDTNITCILWLMINQSMQLELASTWVIMKRLQACLSRTNNAIFWNWLTLHHAYRRFSLNLRVNAWTWGCVRGEKIKRTFCLSKVFTHPRSQTPARTYLAARALVVEGAESDGGEQDGDVEEDGCGHVLQQGFITANYTWGETNTWVIFQS